MQQLQDSLKYVRSSSFQLAGSSIEQRNSFLQLLGSKLSELKEEIFKANEIDLAAAETNNLDYPLLKRLKLQEDKLKTLLKGLNDLSGLPEPLNQTLFARELDKDLNLYRVTCPIGVLCIIFESRPEAVLQISSLAIKSGNCVILKGGKEANETNSILVKIIRDCLDDSQVGLPKDSVTLVKTRQEISELLKYNEYIDLIIPRGSNRLVKYIQENTTIPVMGHADGICHVFVDQHADIDKAIKICIDSKTEYPAVCNACETIIVHRAIMETFLPLLGAALSKKNVTMFCDPTAMNFLKVFSEAELLYETEGDNMEKYFKREYLNLSVSVLILDSAEQAIKHINQYGSHHTDCIVSEESVGVETFLREVDSAGVFHNCSTRFADGFRYGFGAEVGVSTNKLHARGPVGMDGLLTYKYKLIGNGHIVDDYNTNRKQFTHKNLNS